MRVISMMAAFLAATLSAAPVAAQDLAGVLKSSWGIDDTPVGVYCAVNQVRLLAQTAEDCRKAGGTVTHSLTTTATPVDQ